MWQRLKSKCGRGGKGDSEGSLRQQPSQWVPAITSVTLLLFFRLCSSKMVPWFDTSTLLGCPASRASLTVRITVKNGDPSGAGKIWENRFCTGKMDHHGAKCTQIDEGTCQGLVCTCQNFFSFANLVVGVTFLMVIFHLLQKCTKVHATSPVPAIFPVLQKLAYISWSANPIVLKLRLSTFREKLRQRANVFVSCLGHICVKTMNVFVSRV